MENGKAEEKLDEKPVVEPEAEADAGKDETKEDKDKEDEKKEIKEEEVTPELLEKIKSQIEFYFGDINMQRDKFLIEQTKLDEGWVPMSIMLKFKMLASLSTNVETILKAIGDSELMEISEDKKKIRRIPSKPLPVYDESYRKAQAERTIYVKGFPLEGIYVNKLKEFFKDFEPFENIVMRKYHDKEKNFHFKGSVFVQFKTLEDAKAFMARESVKFGDTELIRKFSEDYSVEKAKEREERQLKKCGKDKKTEKEENEAETEEPDEGPALPKATVLHFKELSDGVNREGIRAAFAAVGEDVPEQIVYIDFECGDEEGWIRFSGENSAKTILEKMKDNKLKIEENEVAFRLLEGEEEEEYLKKVKETMVKKRQKIKSKGRGRPKRGRGNFSRGKKRGGSPGRDAVPKKVAKSA